MIYGMCLCVLLVIGIKLGITFLGIKYSVYYSLFFLVGMFTYVIKTTKLYEFIKSALNFLWTGLILGFGILVAKCNLILMEDSLLNIILRLFVSIIGCYIVFEFIANVSIEIKKKYLNTLEVIGKKSLELYVVQVFTLKFLEIDGYELSTINGFIYMLGYFVIVLIISLLIIELVYKNKFSKFILFGKKM